MQDEFGGQSPDVLCSWKGKKINSKCEIENPLSLSWDLQGSFFLRAHLFRLQFQRELIRVKQ